MKKTLLISTFIVLTTFLNVNAQTSTLSIQQQNDDFTIFKGGLKEGHSGLYYFITEKSFNKKCDSIQSTFKNGSNIEDYYLKLRYLITSLNHGHTRISLPTKGNVNYRMAVLDTTKLYLPFELLIVNKQLIIKEDCSKEQLFPKYAVIKSINNVSSKKLFDKMLKYMPADGINQTFKYYSLYNYFYFHYLFNLLYPNKTGVKIELEKDKTHYYIKLLEPKAIDSIYTFKNKKSISKYNAQLDYKSDLPNQTAYLKINSFYKGLIERFGQKYEQFLDSTFTDIKSKNIQNLIIDIRNNEGGGDGYAEQLYSYLAEQETNNLDKNVYVPGKTFKYLKYGIDLSDDFKAYIENPNEFLVNDTTLILKEKYSGQAVFPPAKNQFKGNIFILTNGGSFSAATSFVSQIYKYRKTTNRKIVFLGEENGGDIYCNTGCAGQSYKIKLPNSFIEIDMPLLCFGTLKKDYSKKRLPDHKVFDNVIDLKTNKDAVLDFALKLSQKR